MKTVRSILPFAVAAVAACSSSDAPRAGVTLSVINETCNAGQCDSLVVMAFPSDQPNTPGGLWHLDLGTIATAQRCFALPSSAKFVIVDSGSGDSTTVSWNDAEGLSLAALPPNTPELEAEPSTTSFVPASAAGWALNVPTGRAAVAAEPCTPDGGPSK